MAVILAILAGALIVCISLIIELVIEVRKHTLALEKLQEMARGSWPSHKALQELVDEAHHMALSKGWYSTGSVNIPEKLALVHSEVSEALEEYRKGCSTTEIQFAPDGKPEGYVIELADAVIRILDHCGSIGADLGAAVRVKMDYNAKRPYRHGGKLA